MPSKPLSQVYYWISHRGKLGYFAVQTINRSIILGVRILGLKAKQDKACLTIISHKYKFVYVGIPKTATRSFMDAFAAGGQAIYDSEWYESPADYVRVLAMYPDYYKFTFTRNPWARAVSCYNSKIKDAVLGKQARIMCFYNGLSPQMSFKDFARWLNTEEGSDAQADRHWLSQHILLTGADEKPFCAFTGKYETLEKDLENVCAKLGMPPVTLAQKGHISENRDYRSYYDEETKALIARRYARDIELYGYEF